MGFKNDSIFWVEVNKIKPNPYQPRRDFSEAKLADLAESIRQYGVLQPLVVTRNEIQRDDGGLSSEYELIAGERRLRASRIAGLVQVPVIIRDAEEDQRAKLEIAIIENIQREDLNSMDRARAFDRLIKEFSFTHAEVGKKIGKSREFVSNTIRLLGLPEDVKVALAQGDISEGHARPILMLKDRPEEQKVLFKEVMHKKLTVRETENIARRVALDKVRKRSKMLSPEIIELEKQLTESLGTRVQIEQKDVGGKLVIDFFSPDDLRNILHSFETEPSQEAMDTLSDDGEGEHKEEVKQTQKEEPRMDGEALDDRPDKEKDESQEDDLYSVKNFSI
jgi:ParB family chromosome partitioning protein|tara:strand:- start:1644 stop:2648 length:1005 start_codon:yes stop_codon:yes gene_type:complete